MKPLYELTEEDKKNGWSPAEAANYHAERAAAQTHFILHRPRPRPTQTPRYRPFDYRKGTMR